MGGAAQGLGGLSVPAGHRSALLGSASSRRENGGESRARALGPAALRAALYLVFSLPSLQSCIRVVAFPIVSGDRPRTVQILGLLLLLVQANKVFFLSFFFLTVLTGEINSPGLQGWPRCLGRGRLCPGSAVGRGASSWGPFCED